MVLDQNMKYEDGLGTAEEASPLVHFSPESQSINILEPPSSAIKTPVNKVAAVVIIASLLAVVFVSSPKFGSKTDSDEPELSKLSHPLSHLITRQTPGKSSTGHFDASNSWCSSTIVMDCHEDEFCGPCLTSLVQAVYDFSGDNGSRICGADTVDVCSLNKMDLLGCGEEKLNCTFPADNKGEMAKYTLWASVGCYCETSAGR